MKIIFFGTPDYVLPILEALHKVYDTPREQSLIAVVTQPPRPVGRKQFMTYSAVDNWAHKKKIPIFNSQFSDMDLPEADLGIVAAYGRIIPDAIIKKFKFGILNIHPSLLPKYRGASPTQAAILNGDSETGVSVIKMDSKMDHGPVISKFTEKIEGTDTNETLRKRLFEKSAQFLIDLIPNYLKGKIRLKEQDHEKATFTKILTKESGFIEPKKLADAIAGKGFIEVDRIVRAMQPWPVAWTNVHLGNSEQGKAYRFKILKAHVQFEKLILDKVQLEGKDPVTWEQFRQGHADLF